MKVAVLLRALLGLTLLVTLGCLSPVDPPRVHASGPLCFPEIFYDGVQETADYLWFATDLACDMQTVQDQSYTLKFNHTVQQMIVQMGSNTGSVFEWDLVVKISRPDGRSYMTQQQYDKHADNVGNRQIVYNYTTPQILPAGTVINLHRRTRTPDACTVAGPYGPAGTTACATGQSVQLIGVLN